jgi:hypothetical protein
MHVEEAVEQRGDAGFLVRTGEVVMDVQFLLAEGLEAKASDKLLAAACGSATSCLIVAVLHPRRANGPAAQAQLESRQAGRLGIAIAAGERRAKLTLDLTGQSVTVG